LHLYRFVVVAIQRRLAFGASPSSSAQIWHISLALFF